ncbi:hypothetical protein CQ476_03 [TM7 phage DolZOral124_53_65]|nr:hypothetical protein CQ476_03 [TM7 phage DolZOral124_53_65]
MKKLAKNVQVHIHDNYENIKLGLQLIILALVVVAILDANAISERHSIENREVTARVLERIEKEAESHNQRLQEQTEKINKQLQASCCIMTQVAAENGVEVAQSLSKSECDSLAKDIKDESK